MLLILFAVDIGGVEVRLRGISRARFAALGAVGGVGCGWKWD